MPFKQKSDGSIEFIKIPLDKALYGVEKGQEGKKYLYLRRFDMSGVKYDSIKGFASSFLDAFEESSFEDDWIVPIKSVDSLDFNILATRGGSSVASLCQMDSSFRPWFSLVRTPNNVLYLTKRRLSASTALQSIGLAASFLNPVTAAGAVGWFARKQHAKYKMSKDRGEKDVSVMPKVFVHKIWQVSIKGDLSEAYENIALVIESGDAYVEW